MKEWLIILIAIQGAILITGLNSLMISLDETHSKIESAVSSCATQKRSKDNDPTE